MADEMQTEAAPQQEPVPPTKTPPQEQPIKKASSPIMWFMIIVVVALVAGSGGYWFGMNKSNAVQEQQKTQVTQAPQQGMDTSTGGLVPTEKQGEYSGTEDIPIKSYTLTAQNNTFTPKELTANVGDMLQLNFENKNGNAVNFVIPDLEIALPTIESNSGGAGITFTAYKAGTFEFYSSVGNQRAEGMTGKLIIK